ncbi:Tetratricopeptide repeat protein [Musa troglodytarum]|uniref:Tetratricopeptide repeat protein n=1 Tax=Musa troglodytarum TaxID=320322 RepID=A0A9E7L119_9LILI|nr:Tetratricopeptide repeat protein [Musa troglodytarum]
MSGSGSGEAEAIARASAAAEELYRLRDTYFPRDPEEKTSRLRTLADAALALLDSLPLEQRKSPLQRANYEYLRGKMLDVKLNPSLADAWLCLGNCIWKKGDLPSAKNCFSLALSKANKYLENYERALHGFEVAALKDPGLNADDEAQKITGLLDKIESSLREARRVHGALRAWQGGQSLHHLRPQLTATMLLGKADPSENA